jgi:hypothetical protein
LLCGTPRFIPRIRSPRRLGLLDLFALFGLGEISDLSGLRYFHDFCGYGILEFGSALAEDFAGRLYGTFTDAQEACGPLFRQTANWRFAPIATMTKVR